MSSSKAVTPDSAVIYDHETLNSGDGYNTETGLYTVPESGLCVLTWTTICEINDAFQTVLVVDEAVRGSSWTDANKTVEYHQTTAVVVFTLNPGDHVFIRMGHAYGHGRIVSQSYIGISTISGWKLD
ncbi:uncharacterized protein LOC110450782 [Mizuhopecten yessoensis]|uniref:C1q domain-containing protein n=1 Tax=Mizuhopecten yessoensis TaxID=6573 RepID=A0A210QN60_MIZYE|nr:uncharacterized protein LOC110450782 [Mizuhopecten yessoensis]OWF50145.1 hypothetical protein KP79_PYT14103 [Mizuhopecten yessoensis]